MYFNVRNILPKSGTFPPGHPVYNRCGSSTKIVDVTHKTNQADKKTSYLIVTNTIPYIYTQLLLIIAVHGASGMHV